MHIVLLFMGILAFILCFFMFGAMVQSPLGKVSTADLIVLGVYLILVAVCFSGYGVITVLHKLPKVATVPSELDLAAEAERLDGPSTPTSGEEKFFGT